MLYVNTLSFPLIIANIEMYFCRKSPRYFFENRSTPALPEFLGGHKTGGNSKAANRRVAVLNSVFLERITDLLCSSKSDHNVHQYGFIVTKVGSISLLFMKIIIIIFKYFDFRLNMQMMGLHCMFTGVQIQTWMQWRKNFQQLVVG